MLDTAAAIQTAAAPMPAFETLVAEHLPRLRKRAARLCRGQSDADDVVQDALLRAYRSRDSLRSAERAGGWLLTIVSTTFLDRCRRRRVRPLEVAMTYEPVATIADEDPAWAHLSTADVRAAIAGLPDDVRDTYRLFALDGCDYVTIAARQNIPKATVGTRIMRARRKLRELLQAA